MKRQSWIVIYRKHGLRGLRVDWWVEKEWRQHRRQKRMVERGGEGKGEVVVCFLTLH